MLRPTQVRFENGWIVTGWFRVCWKRDGEKNEDRNCISGVGEKTETRIPETCATGLFGGENGEGRGGGKREGSGRGGK